LDVFAFPNLTGGTYDKTEKTNDRALLNAGAKLNRQIGN